MSFCLLPDFEKWEIVEPRGIPNCGHSENSGLWVAEWLNMQQSFNEQIIGVLEDRPVRMKMTLRLLTGPHNGLRRVIETKASEYWNMHTDGTP
ncbi:Ulp1 protease family carboxy-terminal domain protein [Trifolium medium]|uniref:Ulp1 protease family carboxy-terminal domain protein n=1 Tax=Trifolium medium TaxID=97028 RepID=A0A392Q0K4_9FABA|nr:Ulp1 protease family carboxy-terminal domain protein [Trifolium medium]